MAPPAGRGNVGVIHRRLGIVARQHLVRAAVTVLACGRNSLAGLAVFGVQTMRVRLLRIGVAARASDFRRRLLVRQALHIRVAVHATEHRPVNGMLQLRLVNIQAHRLAVHVLCQRGVRVAGKAIFVLELLRAVCVPGPKKKKSSNRASRKSILGLHVPKQMPDRELPQ